MRQAGLEAARGLLRDYRALYEEEIVDAVLLQVRARVCVCVRALVWSCECARVRACAGKKEEAEEIVKKRGQRRLWLSCFMFVCVCVCVCVCWVCVCMTNGT